MGYSVWNLGITGPYFYVLLYSVCVCLGDRHVSAHLGIHIQHIFNQQIYLLLNCVLKFVF